MSSFSSIIGGLMEQRQNKRILRLSFPNDDGPKALLLPHKLEAIEALSRDFEFKVDLLAEDARIPLKQMLGKMVNVSLVRGDGTLRYFTGYVFEFRLAVSIILGIVIAVLSRDELKEWIAKCYFSTGVSEIRKVNKEKGKTRADPFRTTKDELVAYKEAVGA